VKEEVCEGSGVWRKEEAGHFNHCKKDLKRRVTLSAFRKRTRAVLGRRAHEVACWLHKGSLFYARAGGKGRGEGALRKEVSGKGKGCPRARR